MHVLRLRRCASLSPEIGGCVLRCGTLRSKKIQCVRKLWHVCTKEIVSSESFHPIKAKLVAFSFSKAPDSFLDSSSIYWIAFEHFKNEIEFENAKAV